MTILTMEILSMIKCYKYILAFAIIVSKCYAVTQYENDMDGGSGTVSRTDVIRIGNESGSFAAYTAPPGNITNLTIMFVQSGTVPGGGIHTPFSVATFPSALKELKISGDARYFDTLVGGSAGNALPTPPDGCTVRFALVGAPATPPAHWFKTAMGENCRVVVEPGTVDPHLGNILVGFGSTGLGATNTLVVGSNITLPASLTDIKCKIQRHPKILAVNTNTSAKVTISADIVFEAAVNGVSLGGTGYASVFAVTSDIIDPDGDLGMLTANNPSAPNPLGTVLTLVALANPLPTLITRPISTGEQNTVTKIVPSLTALPLPVLSPALSTAY